MNESTNITIRWLIGAAVIGWLLWLLHVDHLLQ